MAYKRVILFFLLAGFIRLFSQGSDLTALIQKIDEQSKQYVEYKSFSAKVVSTSKEMDDRWNPESLRIIEKEIIVKDGKNEQIIEKATEVKKGKEKDITEKVREEVKKREMEENQERKEEGQKNEKEDESRSGRHHHSYSMNLEEMLPFSEEKRGKYTFNQLEDTLLSGKPALCIQAKAKVEERELFEGKYYIDPNTNDMIMADITPSKNPKFVKKMRIILTFEVLPSNHLILKSSWMRLFAGILIKKVRMEVEEVYSDYKITG